MIYFNIFSIGKIILRNEITMHEIYKEVVSQLFVPHRGFLFLRSRARLYRNKG